MESEALDRWKARLKRGIERESVKASGKGDPEQVAS